MVNKSKIIEARQGETIASCSWEKLEELLADCLDLYCLDSGKRMSNDEDKVTLVGRWAESIKHPFMFLYLDEVKLCLKWAGQGHLGDVDWPSIPVLNDFLRKYTALNERKVTIANESSAKMLPESAPMSEGELRSFMATKWKLVCEAERQGKLYDDFGNVLFDYMESKGKIKLEECDMEEAVNFHLSCANAPEGVGLGIQQDMSKDAIKRHKKGDSSLLIPKAKRFALRRLRQEQLLEIEARKINEQKK